VLELWQQLTSSNAGLLNKKVREREPGSETSTKEPLIDFVGMECDLAGDLCSSVDAALNSLKKVKRIQYEFSRDDIA
jgi:hypothetical protein